MAASLKDRLAAIARTRAWEEEQASKSSGSGTSLPKTNFNFTPLNQRQPEATLPQTNFNYTPLNQRMEDPNLPATNFDPQLKEQDPSLPSIGEGALSGSRLRETRGDRPIPRVSRSQSEGIVKDYGLDAFGDRYNFTGMTFAEARAEAQRIKDEKLSQVSQRTSFSFNPKTISGFGDKFRDFKIKLDDLSSSPFLGKQDKQDKTDIALKSFASDAAGLFNTQQEFDSALEQSPEFQNTLQQYENAGGSISDIEANIAQPVTQPSDVGIQTIDQYLGAINTQQEKMAIESLIPEKKIAQDQIALEQSIPDRYKEMYFGTEEQVGLLDRQQTEAEEAIRLAERQAEIDERNARARADLLADKYAAEQKREEAIIEKNRLAAKNYLTGTLAKLGALKTTGEAPVALANLEQKYQQQSQELRQDYRFANRELANKLRESVDDIEITRDENILKIKEDLSKSEEEVYKEIFKLQNKADRETLKIADGFARDFRSQTDKYRKELEKKAKDYAKSLEGIISSYDVGTFSEFVSGVEQSEGISLARGQEIGDGIFAPDSTKLLIPSYFETLLDSEDTSLGLKEVVSGRKTIDELSSSAWNKVRKEMKGLGITDDMIKTIEEPESDLTLEIRDAQEAISKGVDKQEVKRMFLERFPTKGSFFEQYINN